VSSTPCMAPQGGCSAIQTLGTGALQHVRCIFRELVYFWFEVDAACEPAAVKPDTDVAAASTPSMPAPVVTIKVCSDTVSHALPMNRERTITCSSPSRGCTTHLVYISICSTSTIALQEEAELWAPPAGQAGVPLIAATPKSAGSRVAKKCKAAALDEEEAEALLDERAHAWSQAHQFAALG
jgi:hypothetical protein